jgi:hypothetical protein
MGRGFNKLGSNFEQVSEVEGVAYVKERLKEAGIWEEDNEAYCVYSNINVRFSVDKERKDLKPTEIGQIMMILICPSPCHLHT